MSTTIKAGWLNDSQGNRFAPKTLSSQVINDDGTLLKDSIDTAISEKQDKDMVVTITSTTAEDGTETHSADKTFEEIKAAINNKVNVYVKNNGTTYNLLKLTNNNIHFTSYTHSSMLFKKFVIKNDDAVTFTSTNVVATENIYGGIKASAKSDTDTVEAKIGTDGKLYVPEYPVTDTEMSAESENPVQNKVVKEYVDTTLSSLTSGTTIVGEAGHAAMADSAINATNDADGNVITDTYETKEDAEEKLEEAKEYTDNAISLIPTGETITDITDQVVDRKFDFSVVEQGLYWSDTMIMMLGVSDQGLFQVFKVTDTIKTVFCVNSGRCFLFNNGNISLTFEAVRTNANYNDLSTVNKEIIDAINELNSGKANTSDVESTYETKSDATTKLNEAKEYADTAVANLVNSAPETLDTLGELATAFEENKSIVDTLNAAITNKADLEHIHEVIDINGLQDTLDEINVSLGNKSDIDHDHNETYYTQTQINEMEFITVDDIDEICGETTEGSVLESDVDELMNKLK